MKTTLLRLHGTHYENGLESGRFFKKIIQDRVKELADTLNCPKDRESYEIVLNKLKLLYPEYVDEVAGKATGADVDFKLYWALMCPDISNIKFEHCTTIVCKDRTGHFLLSHNEDDNYLDGNFCLSKIHYGDSWLMTNDIYNMPFGNGFSWNSHGIIKTINYCHEPSPIITNIPSYFLQRHLSDATSIKDLVNRCQAFHPASGFHVNAIDRNTNEAVSIEVYPDKISVKHIDDLFIHSNHYIRDQYISNPVTDKGSNSIFRFGKAKELFDKSGDNTIDGLKQILRFRDNLDRFEYSIFQTKNDPYITGMNFSYSVLEENSIYLDVFPSNEKLILDYDM